MKNVFTPWSWFELEKHCIQIKCWYCLHSYSFSRMFRTFWKIRIGSSFSNGTSLWSLEWIHLRFASLIVLRRCWDARDKCRSAIWEMFFTKTLCKILKAVLRVNGLKPFAFFFFSKINYIISNDNNIFSIFFSC